jgi:hypothetical protein
VEHPGVSAMTSAALLQRCWHEGVSFDVGQRTGTVFNICPATSSKALGLVCMGAVAHAAVATLGDALDAVSTVGDAGAAAAAAGSAKAVGAEDAASVKSKTSRFAAVHTMVKHIAHTAFTGAQLY